MCACVCVCLFVFLQEFVAVSSVLFVAQAHREYANTAVLRGANAVSKL